jgi:nicotinamide phosphoribosyltransferase
MNAINMKDAYKIGHKDQYPEGTTEIYSNFTARSGNYSNVPNSKGIVFVGLQYFIMDYLIEDWNNTFFNRPIEKVVAKYKRRVSNILGYDVNVDHVRALHRLGYLPIIIKALPEGSFVPYGVPVLTIKNTHPDFFWVTNMLETVLSCELWQPITSATTYAAYRKIGIEYAELTGAAIDFVPFQFHDFSMRGMAGRHAAAISGFAALAAGSYGTDCVPAIDLAEEYYGANSDKELVGVSVNATEHSVQCSGSKENEYETYIRLMTDIYPEGILSIVSDTWDFWNVVSNFLPRLKDTIMSRNGKVVIRPDSGDPVDIICGLDIEILDTDDFDYAKRWAADSLEDEIRCSTPHGEGGVDEHSGIFKWKDSYYEAKIEIWWNRHDKKYYYIGDSELISFEEIEILPEQKGLVESLWDTFGGTINTAGFKELDSHIGAIYGDSITLDRAERIFKRLAKKGFASSNIVLGVGSASYQGGLG